MIIIRNDEQDDGERDAEVWRVMVVASMLMGCARPKAKMTRHQSHEHGGRNVDQRFAVPLRAEPLDQAVQNPGQRDHFENQRQCGGVVELRQAGAVGHDAGGEKENRALPGKQRDQSLRAPPREHGKGDQQQARGQQVRAMRRSSVRCMHSHSSSQQKMNEQAQHGEQERHRQILRRAEDAQFGRQRFDQRQRRAGHHQLYNQSGDGQQQRRSAPSAPWVAMPQGRNSAKPMQA